MRNKTKIASVILLLALIGYTGCTTTARRSTYNSVASIGLTVDAAMKSYCDLVVSGALPADNLENVSKAYNDFQISYRTALTFAQFAPNQPPPTDLLIKAGAVTTAISQAKGSR